MSDGSGRVNFETTMKFRRLSFPCTILRKETEKGNKGKQGSWPKKLNIHLRQTKRVLAMD
jgi:hypothetical protein